MKTLLRTAPVTAGLLGGLVAVTAGTVSDLGALTTLAAAVLLPTLLWTALWVVGWVRGAAPPDPKSGSSRNDSLAAAPRPHEPLDGGDLVGQMLWEQRYALLLRPQVAANLSDEQQAQAQQALQEQMSLIPEGDVFLCQPDDRDDDEKPLHAGGRVVRVEAALLDRYPVTNRQFKQFVDAGGYDEMALWEEIVWPAVFGFVDATGQAGPKYWKDGAYPHGEDEYPVVGISWHEACAYARWVGKRLPSDAEWVKAGAWPMPLARGLPKQRRYPWGDAWEPDRANTWGTALGRTSPVAEFEEGASVAGVYGLVGNVWEWTADSFGLWHGGILQDFDEALKSLRGGAFDTYFESQASCQFQSGDSPLARKHNIGFRCAVGLCDLQRAAETAVDGPAAEHPHAEHQLVCEEA